MSRWRGLYRPERHTPLDDEVAWCDCESDEYVTICQDGSPCKCCLQESIRLALLVCDDWWDGKPVSVENVEQALGRIHG